MMADQPENFFAEIEQAAFSPSNLVPGIAVTPDPSKLSPSKLCDVDDEWN